MVSEKTQLMAVFFVTGLSERGENSRYIFMTAGSARDARLAPRHCVRLARVARRQRAVAAWPDAALITQRKIPALRARGVG